MMRVIGYIHDYTGCTYHRIIAPLMLMQDVKVYITNDFKESDFEEGCDVVFFNRLLPINLIPKLLELKLKYGFKIICDIDDYWHLDQHHVLYESYIQDEYAVKQTTMLSIANVVTTTNSRLADKVKEHNKNVFVLPNAIPKTGQFDLQRNYSIQPRLFWQGSQTHRKDVEILRPVSSELYHTLKQCKMVMAGYNGDSEWDSMIFNYTAGTLLSCKIIEAAPVHSYYNAYKEADICLVPLVDSNFNKYKSNLKVLEAANLGLPVICSKVNPYLDFPILYAENNKEWIRHIKRLVESRKAQKECGKELKAFVDVHYNFDKINLMRKQIFER
jgi:glycosyltransferase involved in cell wall biosynthesis